MKKYKIGQRIITAKSPIQAVKLMNILDSCSSNTVTDTFIIEKGSTFKSRNMTDPWMIRILSVDNDVVKFQTMRKTNDNKIISGGIDTKSLDKFKMLLESRYRQTTSIYDEDSFEIDYLTKEEEKAVDDYRKAIAGTTNPKLLELYKHILDEELEHIKELQSQDVEDCDMKDYAPPYAIWVKKDGKWLIFGGATSTNIDKRRFLASGYENVIVVENGKEPK